MSDRDVEEALRECWPAEPPAGMRHCVLSAARREPDVRPRPEAARRAPRWQTAFACAGVLLVAGAYGSDRARQVRLSQVVTGGRPGPSAAEVCRMLERQRALDRLVAAGASWEVQPWAREADGL